MRIPFFIYLSVFSVNIFAQVDPLYQECVERHKELYFEMFKEKMKASLAGNTKFDLFAENKMFDTFHAEFSDLSEEQQVECLMEGSVLPAKDGRELKGLGMPYGVYNYNNKGSKDGSIYFGFDGYENLIGYGRTFDKNGNEYTYAFSASNADFSSQNNQFSVSTDIKIVAVETGETYSAELTINEDKLGNYFARQRPNDGAGTRGLLHINIAFLDSANIHIEYSVNAIRLYADRLNRQPMQEFTGRYYNEHWGDDIVFDESGSFTGRQNKCDIHGRLLNTSLTHTKAYEVELTRKNCDRANYFSLDGDYQGIAYSYVDLDGQAIMAMFFTSKDENSHFSNTIRLHERNLVNALK